MQGACLVRRPAWAEEIRELIRQCGGLAGLGQGNGRRAGAKAHRAVVVGQQRVDMRPQRHAAIGMTIVLPVFLVTNLTSPRSNRCCSSESVAQIAKPLACVKPKKNQRAPFSVSDRKHGLGDPDAPVEPEDVETCLRLVRAHLEAADGRSVVQEATRNAFPALPYAIPPRLISSEGQDSGQGGSIDATRDSGDSAKMVDDGAPKMENENLAFPATVGQLHEVIESIGPNAWPVFIGLWHQACGVEPPVKEGKCKSTRPSPDLLNTGSNRFTRTVHLLEESKVETLRKLPPRVRAFWLREEPVPPAWRQETAGQYEQRAQSEVEGAWAGS